ncbi:exported protein of unknown function [Kyrpidia spormannii]|uniref:Uncharacterized protein n=1 Tax=Kyrpidia spormannii TaxID=2055160 RepID=A0A6F9EHP0_9BACL|nr:exported protein of unknown function [Kyrpidia spormannii]
MRMVNLPSALICRAVRLLPPQPPKHPDTGGRRLTPEVGPSHRLLYHKDRPGRHDVKIPARSRPSERCE